MRSRIVLAAVLAASSFGVLAAQAGAADPVGQLCGSIHVTVNGQALVDQEQCQVLPPQQ
jgi:hypothetical protein